MSIFWNIHHSSLSTAGTVPGILYRIQWNPSILLNSSETSIGIQSSLRKMALNSDEAVIAANQKLLNAIAAGNYLEYQKLCASDITCVEPETAGNIVQGLDFHKYYFDLGEQSPKPKLVNNVTMARPNVRWMGDSAAVLTYVRVDQTLAGGVPVTKTCCETRVWEIRNSKLVNVHFHKSL